MCIAIVKPQGAKLPSKELLKTCWENNPDGGGLMYNNGENVIIHKGFTKFKGFYKYLVRLNNLYNLEDKDVVIHFRIATSGGVNRECTHPFPVTHNIEEMKKLDTICDFGFAHNGIISGYGSKEFSDTMEYDKDIIANIPDLENCESLLHALALEHASRFAILTKDNFELGGNWKKDGDCYFSNDYYKYSWRTTKWEELYEDLVRCECCQDWCLPEDTVSTGYGRICNWCYDEIMDSVKETPKEDKELVF